MGDQNHPHDTVIIDLPTETIHGVQHLALIITYWASFEIYLCPHDARNVSRPQAHLREEGTGKRNDLVFNKEIIKTSLIS